MTMLLDNLTPRENEILQLLARGMTDPEIGHILGISSRTVRTHNSHMFSKLGVRNRTEAVLTAQRLGLLKEKI